MLYLTRLEFTAQLERIGYRLGYMGEAKRERKIYTVQTDIFFLAVFHIIMIIDRIITFEIVEGFRPKLVDIVVIVRKAIC